MVLYKTNRKLASAFSVAAFLLFTVLAEPTGAMNVTLITEIAVDEATLPRGLTAVSDDKNFRLGIFPDVLTKKTGVVIKQFDRSGFFYPKGWRAASDVYEFEILNKESFNDEKSLLAVIAADEETKQLRKVFLLDTTKDEWTEIPSDTIDQKSVKVALRLSRAKLVVLRHEEVLGFGQASWYKYKNCLCAASPDYKKGTRLRVTNLDNKKTVVVEVNDYGPDRSVFPSRVIDLDKVAFKNLGRLSQGVLKNVLVEEIK